ncbi:hypothetical protein [Aeromonas veronii]|uniref:hypothetical protein n=1 Tax=Aeromonas veronii TaxID=654 RepID=UPI00188304DE|nr:hypothetical protein [Aeromonas veronii]MBE8734512.1 hypothetical protein [Aeromonas veronii]MBE8737947.1 hypothetical protein [Aeromonas veronii]MBE8743112.1 hypothetical protein [Aeromonas veronii]MBE8762416.1 hypothetical protein [Aeromonas veronii]MBE8838658.1 hypothetical protein [Aeromonas veronii]
MKIEAVKFSMGSRYVTPVNMIATLAEHQGKADTLISQAAERMNQELVELREKLRKEIPVPDYAAYRAELVKARESAQKRLDDGIAAASAAISETDYLKSAMALQTRMIGGASLEQLLSELGDYKALNSLALLAEQLGRTGVASEAKAKAIEIATNGSQKEIDQLSGCLLDLVNAESSYLVEWENMLGQLGRGADE